MIPLLLTVIAVVAPLLATVKVPDEAVKVVPLTFIPIVASSYLHTPNVMM
jgi:hypothetical protein